MLFMVAGQVVENKRKWCQLVGVGLLVFFTETQVGVIHGSREYKKTGQYSYCKQSCDHGNLWSIKALLKHGNTKARKFKFNSYHCHYRGYAVRGYISLYYIMDYHAHFGRAKCYLNQFQDVLYNFFILAPPELVVYAFKFCIAAI